MEEKKLTIYFDYYLFLIHRIFLLLLYNFGTLGCQLMSSVKSGSKSITRTNGLADSACITSKVIFQTVIIITIHCAWLTLTGMHWLVD